MRIAAGVIAWHDGPELLARTFESVAGVADELIVVDGIVAGIDAGGLDELTPLDDIPAVEGAHLIQAPNLTQSGKRTVMLEAARELGCDWLLSIDADERLHDVGAGLRAYLAAERRDYWPIPFQYENGGPAKLAAWKCVRVPAWRRVASQGGFLEHASGTVYAVWNTQNAPDGFQSWLPWLSHHPDERPPQRAGIRLGVVEHELEPYIAEAVELPFGDSFAAASVIQTARPVTLDGG